MSFVRRLAVGLPAAGVTALAALAISSPVLATDTTRAGHPVVMASPDRGNAGYQGELPATTAPTATAVPTTTAPAPATASPDTTGGTRGQRGYGGVSPTTEQPTGSVQSAPTGGVSSATAPTPTGTVSTKGAGVSSGSLPLTGGPVGATIAVGLALVAGGAGALWYTRRRKNA
ncbi:LPXTG cell wall anchor domain-containing protein [Actinoplanes teichomyceticus]|uniref:LPXTG-motif cell wall-anchored protein n=1 Tax=Actinoplanes teichomyceticus TaxID=1867 RepID=A0A561WMY1_ACTTI|nr:LPXTG cell wall anchor domain-containing protein [Actinoplanes teichomyceticus]TWG25193.1 LPXTG-motif cell wall-anchored protein [Actinoplanes teichomyceticus]GIF10262.1 hypothetical protein Ate01nite_02940 [Actinoplanes teichomyceticus]